MIPRDFTFPMSSINSFLVPHCPSHFRMWPSDRRGTELGPSVAMASRLARHLASSNNANRMVNTSASGSAPRNIPQRPWAICNICVPMLCHATRFPTRLSLRGSLQVRGGICQERARCLRIELGTRNVDASLTTVQG